MGYEIVRQMRKRKLPGNEMSIWTALGDHASDVDGSGAWPSQLTLANETGYADRTVRRILRKLEKRGAIVEAKKPGRRTSREYRIVLDAIPLLTVETKSRPEKMSGLTEIKTGHPGHQDRTFRHQDRTSSALRPDNLSAKPSESSFNPQRKPQTRARELRDIAPSPARETIIGDRKGPKSVKKDTDDETERSERETRIAKKAAEIQESIRLKLSDGLSRVIPEPDKYAEFKA